MEKNMGKNSSDVKLSADATEETKETLWQKVKTFMVLQLGLGYIFMMSGLIVTALIALLWLLVGTWNKQLYRKIYCYLTYSVWCNITFVGQWWAGMSIELYGDPGEFARVGKEHVFVTMNHKYDIDWLAGWILCERLKILGSNKTFAKSSLRWVPIIGWIWSFTESIFLHRSLHKDRDIILDQMKNLADFPADLPVTVLFFPEGTRFTREKHAASLEFAASRGLPQLQHHLTPRTRGFWLAARAMKGVHSFPAIYDLCVAFHERPWRPTLLNLVCGRPIRAVIHFRRIPLEDIPTDSLEECEQWLHQLYVDKDAKMSGFYEQQRFSGSRLPIEKRRVDLLIYLCWVAAIGLPTLLWLARLVVASSWHTNVLILLLAVVFSLGVRSLISVTEAHKGSAYGKTL